VVSSRRSPDPIFRATYEEHDAIVRTVRSGSANALERAVRANWFNGAERLAAVIEQSDTAVLIGAGLQVGESVKKRS
jgi:DNA-binding FadR family transcriptional regulator